MPQGVTLAPLIRLLRLDREEDPDKEAAAARVALADAAALASLQYATGPEADNLRYRFGLLRNDCNKEALQQLRLLGLRAAQAQRHTLEELRAGNRINIEGYLIVEERTDWFELTMLENEDRRIEEI